MPHRNDRSEEATGPGDLIEDRTLLKASLAERDQARGPYAARKRLTQKAMKSYNPNLCSVDLIPSGL